MSGCFFYRSTSIGQKSYGIPGERMQSPFYLYKSTKEKEKKDGKEIIYFRISN